MFLHLLFPYIFQYILCFHFSSITSQPLSSPDHQGSSTHFIVLVLSYSSCWTQLWNSTASSRIHSSVTTGMMSCLPTTSLPCRTKSFTPNSTSGIPLTTTETNDSFSRISSSLVVYTCLMRRSMSNMSYRLYHSFNINCFIHKSMVFWVRPWQLLIYIKYVYDLPECYTLYRQPYHLTWKWLFIKSLKSR